MQKSQQPESQDWKSDSYVNSLDHARGDEHSATPLVKTVEPQHNEDINADENPIGNFYVSTPFNPPRIDRCRVDNFLMLVIMALMFIFGVAALSTPIVSYSSSAITITVDCLSVRGGSTLGTRQRSQVRDVFCRNFSTKADGFAALLIICVLFSVLGFLLSLPPIICGRVICCRYFVQVLTFLCWLFVMVSMILAAQMRNDALCRSTSLKSIGFEYGPAFGLVVTLFVFFSIVMIVLAIWMICYPAKLRY
ncbi:hypothetical protein ABL78_6047 [Leptomonas seymouri]|uniref:Amastin-like protein n=1 Tax=Leptomonas seymouri TaxID=5684 RepID=A0A0N1I1D0_LEPSE|nr:hypothetical protein ABL78_6047 [Leptomonas seymouri]|eukprot:KPI84892.1 hypothetical protein ABL78_6047 [Leptomonas seymouri]